MGRVCNLLPVQTITVPIGAGPSDLGRSVDQVQSGIQVMLPHLLPPKT